MVSYDNDPDPSAVNEYRREREYHRWVLNGSDPQDEPEWLVDDEVTYCDDCGDIIDEGKGWHYDSLPADVSSARQGESGSLCADCNDDMLSMLANDEGCGKWGCKECYPERDGE